MPYRGDDRCHICGAEAASTCPGCGNGVCAEHSLAARLERDAPASLIRQADRIAKRLGGPDVCAECLDHEIASARGPHEAIHRTTDPIETQMIVEALQEAGFDARALGTAHGAMLGAGQHIFEQRIEVPTAQAWAAAGLITALAEGVGGADLAAAAERAAAAEGSVASERPGEDAPTDRALSPRRPLVAAAVAFLFPGASHIYTRRLGTAVPLTLTFFAGLVLLSQGGRPRGALLLVGGAVLADLVGGQLAARAANRDKPLPALFQLLHGLVLAGLLALGAAALGG